MNLRTTIFHYERLGYRVEMIRPSMMESEADISIGPDGCAHIRVGDYVEAVAYSPNGFGVAPAKPPGMSDETKAVLREITELVCKVSNKHEGDPKLGLRAIEAIYNKYPDAFKIDRGKDKP